MDFERLYGFVLESAFFVPRTKAGIQLHRLESRPVDRSCGLRSDHIVWLAHPQSVRHYPDRLRRVSYRDPEHGTVRVFLTNNFDLPALVIAQLYKLRWRVELFFKWIKQKQYLVRYPEAWPAALKVNRLNYMSPNMTTCGPEKPPELN